MWLEKEKKASPFWEAVLRYQVAVSGDKDLSPLTAAASLAREGWGDLAQLCRHRRVASVEAVRELNVPWLMAAIWLERGRKWGEYVEHTNNNDGHFFFNERGINSRNEMKMRSKT